MSDAGRSAVQSASGKLYSDRRIQLWVVFVDNFSGQPAVSWADSTRAASDLGDFDAVLAVATVDHAYAFRIPNRVKTINAGQVDDLRRNQIEPALRRGDWSGAAVAAANGLDRGPESASSAPLLIGLGVIIAAVVALYVFTRWRRRRRRAAELAAARRVDATDPDALASLSLGALDDLSRWKVVDVDNAVRTSANELALTIEEFGEQRTQPFTRAVDAAKSALAQAFAVRQQLDDAIPETRQRRRELLTEVIVAAARADRELESQREDFEEMRDLVVNAPSRLDALTQQVVDLTARIEPAEQRMTELHQRIRLCRAGLGGHQRRDRQGPAGVRRAESRPGPREGVQAGQRRTERPRRRRACRGIVSGTSPLAARRGRQRRQRHPARGRDAAVADRRHPVRNRARRHRTAERPEDQGAASARSGRAPATPRPGLSTPRTPAAPRIRWRRSPR